MCSKCVPNNFTVDGSNQFGIPGKSHHSKNGHCHITSKDPRGFQLRLSTRNHRHICRLFFSTLRLIFSISWTWLRHFHSQEFQGSLVYSMYLCMYTPCMYTSTYISMYVYSPHFCLHFCSNHLLIEPTPRQALAILRALAFPCFHWPASMALWPAMRELPGHGTSCAASATASGASERLTPHTPIQCHTMPYNRSQIQYQKVPSIAGCADCV